MKNNKEKEVTIVDIAKYLQLSNITVSRAFSNPQLVKQETRELIYETAAKLKYRPNAFARSLKTNSSKLIGVITDSTYNPVYAQVVKELCEKADKNGYTLMMFETAGNSINEERALDALFSYKVAGIVLSVVHDIKGYKPSYVQRARGYNIPLVLLDRDIDGYRLPGVFLNNYEIGVKCGNYLAQKEIKKLLIVGGPEESLITQERIKGILSILETKQVDYEIVYADYAYDKAKENLKTYFKTLPNPPSHFVGINGLISLAFIGMCRQYGIKDVDYFSIDEVPYAKDFGFDIPCVYSSPFEWGQKISELLFNLIENNNSSKFNERLYVLGKVIA